MGNELSSDKSPKAVRRSTNSKESDQGNYYNQQYNRNLTGYNCNNPNTLNNYSSSSARNQNIKNNKSKSIIDLISTKIHRSKILNTLDSLKIVNISSKITNKVLSLNLDYSPVNLLSSSLIPNSRQDNNNFLLNKEVAASLNVSLNSLIFEENFTERKANEYRNRGIDRIYFNNLIKNNRIIGNYLNTNTELREKIELNNLFLNKDQNVKNLIKEKIEKFLQESESLNLNSERENILESEATSQSKEVTSALSSKIASSKHNSNLLKNNQKPQSVYSKNKKREDHSNNKLKNKINDSEIDISEKQNESQFIQQNKVLKLDLGKAANASLNKTNQKTGSNFNITPRSKSPGLKKYELMKNYNKTKVTGFYKREGSTNTSRQENSNYTSPRNTEKGDVKTPNKPVKEVLLKIKINPGHRSPESRNRDNNRSNLRNNLISKSKMEESYYATTEAGRNIESTKNFNEKTKNKYQTIDLTINDSQHNKDLNSDKNRFNASKLDRSPNRNPSKSPTNKKLTHLNFNNQKDKSFSKLILNTEVIDYKPEKFNYEARINQTERIDTRNENDYSNYNYNSNSNYNNYNTDRNNDYDYRGYSGYTDRNNRDNQNTSKENIRANFPKMPETTVKSKCFIYFLFYKHYNKKF